jgi:hypothetical protein
MLLKPAKDSVDLLILVSDIRKSLDFYQGILGLEKTQEVQTPFGTVHRLRYGTSVVKLMDPKQVPPASPIGLEKQLGIRCLSFVIHDLSGVCIVLKEKQEIRHNPVLLARPKPPKPYQSKRTKP